MLSVENWAEIRRLHRGEGIPIKAIARMMGCSKNTVKKALAAQSPPRYQRAPVGSIVDAVEPQIRELLKAYPTMPATVIAERIGWDRSIRVLRDRVAELRPVYLPPDPASRTVYRAGELAQFDFWFPDITLPVGCGQTRTATRLPVLTMVSGYSRFRAAVLVPSRGEQDLFAGWWANLLTLGAVPRTLVWDGEGAVGRWRARAPELTAATHAFRGVLGAKVIDFNAQIAGWVAGSNHRRMRVLGCTPEDRVAADRAAMLPLPPVAPATGWSWSTRLPRDHYVRLDANDYSVHPGVVGRRIQVTADLERVVVTCEGVVVAEHPRSWAKHQSFTDPAHAAAAVALRRGRLAVPVPPAATEVEQRDLSVYDALIAEALVDEGVA